MQEIRFRKVAVQGGRGIGRRKGRRGPALALLATTLLAGCSYVPDALNPVEWYKGVSGWFGGDQTVAASPPAEAKPATGAAQPYPSVASVPERPQPTAPAAREQVAQGLLADRDSARYTDEVIERGPRVRRPEVAAAPATPRVERAAPAARPAAPAPVERVTPAPAVPAPPGPLAAAPAPAAPAQRAPMAQVPAAPPPVPILPPAPAVTAAAPGAPAGEVRTVYQSRLAESAPTVTTRPVGPTSLADVARGPLAPAAEAATAQPAATVEPAAPPPAAEAARPARPAPTAAPRPLDEFDPYASAVSFQLASIYFPHGSARLSGQDREILREAARAQRERGGTVRVIGHASSRTGDMDPLRHQVANFRVSMERANVVVRELIRYGVEPGKIYVGAVSDAEPVYYEVMPAGEAGNRRAEIYLDY